MSNEIKFINIPGAEDSDKRIELGGEQVLGCVYKGWLRSGGEQWVYDGPLGKFGASSLKQMKREVSRKISKV